MAGKIWMRSRPPLSACTFCAQGWRKKRWTLLTAGRKWCSRKVVSCAAAARGAQQGGRGKRAQGERAAAVDGHGGRSSGALSAAAVIDAGANRFKRSDGAALGPGHATC